uniref:Uncharacterized protein n=1 Tax=Cucumis melo TaxID=3656 RepID=A0A9I9EGK1_CUCME
MIYLQTQPIKQTSSVGSKLQSHNLHFAKQNPNPKFNEERKAIRQKHMSDRIELGIRIGKD